MCSATGRSCSAPTIRTGPPKWRWPRARTLRSCYAGWSKRARSSSVSSWSGHLCTRSSSRPWEPTAWNQESSVMSRRPAGPMQKFWAVFRREYLERIQSRWYIFATIAGPVFFGSVITAPQIFTRKAHPSADVSHIIILDATRTDLGTRIAKALQGGPQSDSLPTALRPEVRSVLPAAIKSAQDAATAEIVHQGWIGYLVVDSAAMAGADVYYAGRNVSRPWGLIRPGSVRSPTYESRSTPTGSRTRGAEGQPSSVPSSRTWWRSRCTQ